MAEQTVYSIPQRIKDYIDKMGYPLPCNAMGSYVDKWNSWMRADGDFYNYSDKDGFGRVYKVHRRTIKPAKRMAFEWGSLLLNDKTQVSCDEQACSDWLASYYDKIDYFAHGQGLVSRAFALGTGAWAIWADTQNLRMQLRRYDARMVIPLSWDDDGVSECAFVTRASVGGKMLDQLQMHLIGDKGYVIKTVFFNFEGETVSVDGVLDDFETGCETPTFAIVRPAIENTAVDLSPYGMSIYADAIDAIQGVDLAYDAFLNEIDLGKMRIFLGDMMFETTSGGENGPQQAVPFGKSDAVVFRKIGSSEDVIQEFAPALRTEAQMKVYRGALQTLGDMCGFGLKYFDIDERGGIGFSKTATEVSSDNSALMRNIRKHENLLEGAMTQISHAALHCARQHMHVSLPDEGDITVNFDDSIITDTASEKTQDMAEVGVTMNAWEYRMKWYGEDEETARRMVSELGGEYESPGITE